MEVHNYNIVNLLINREWGLYGKSQTKTLRYCPSDSEVNFRKAEI